MDNKVIKTTASNQVCTGKGNPGVKYFVNFELDCGQEVLDELIAKSLVIELNRLFGLQYGLDSATRKSLTPEEEREYQAKLSGYLKDFTEVEPLVIGVNEIFEELASFAKGRGKLSEEEKAIRSATRDYKQGRMSKEDALAKVSAMLDALK